jgi:carbon monoxide dehydrogenase subunit G
MDMTGERRIPAPRLKVWAALNDPAVLKSCIPGCESLEKTDDHLKATAAVKIGPISARFTGKVQLLDLDPPNAYRIEGEGQGGVAGFAKGGAAVRLTDDGDITVLTYDVKAQVGGKIAQLGARLIDATAKQMADTFFNRFVAEVSDPPAASAVPPVVSAPTDELGADGMSGLLSKATGEPATVASPPPPAVAQISLFDLIPREPFGFPIVFWIGGVIWLLIFILIFGSYL